MSDIILTAQTAPATPAAGKADVYVDSTTKKLASKDSAGIVTDYMGQDGWIGVNWASLTRTGATTFTTSSNVSAIVQKGDKLRFTDTTTKYLNVVSAVWAGGVTTITTIANNDYALVGHPSAMYYSKVENPQGWPGWFNYTATMTGFSSVPTSVTSKFSIIGNTCFVYHAEGVGGTSNATTFTVSLPVLASSFIANLSIAIDNGTYVSGAVAYQDGSNPAVANLYKSGFAGWTASGTKQTIFSAFYNY